MIDDPRVDELLEELLVSGGSPEEVCRSCPELLPLVRAGLLRLRLVEQELGALFPPSEPPGGVRLVALPTAELPSIPGYEVEGELGCGGVGVVYRARHLRLDRPVAVKMLLAGAFARPEERERFLREAQALAALGHPNIVQVHDFGELGGLPYFAMEYLEGGNLAQKLAGTPLPPREAAALSATLAEAVEAAHRSGIVHRDLKPANVLLTAAGTPKIGDFGLARRLDGGGGATLTGTALGTPSYMAPEQARGETRAIGPAADVYALGAILYELLTGRPPFRAETPSETVHQVIYQDPAPPSRLNAGVPRDLETICLKCLEKDPRRRYPTARALADDLRAWLEGRPMAARRASAAERFGRWCRRNPAPAALAAAVVVVALGATLAAFRFRAVSRELESNLYFSDITLAHRELSQDNLGRAQKLLDDCPPGLRQWEWYYLTRLCRVDPIVFRDEAEVFSVAFSPDGERLASAGADGTIRVRNSRTGEVLQALNANTDFVAYSVAFHPGGHHLAAAGADPRVKQVKVWDLTTEKVVFARPGSVDTTRRAHGVAFSPDGRRLASGSGGEVHVWDWSNDQRLHILPGHFKGGISVAFSPDGRRLASASWNGDIMIWDAETGQRLHILSEHHHSVSALAFSRDGRRLVSASYDHHLIAWDATKGQRLRILPGHDGLVTDVAFSPDDRYLASVGEDKVVRLWEAASGREVLSLRGHTKWCRSVAFSPDGRRIASAGWDATIRLWDATPLRGDEDQGVLTFSQHADEVSTMAISPDGQRVASAGPAAGRIALPVRVWDVRSGLVSTEFTGHAVAVFSAAWHPDGRRIASSGWNEGRTRFVVKVWDAQTARDAFGLAPGPGGETFAMAFSPDGRHLVTGGTSRVVQVWDAQTGEFVSTLGAHDRAIRGLAFSPDGRHLASVSGDSKMKLWDATRLTEAQEARRTVPVWVSWFPFNLAFSPDGRHLVAGGEKNTVGIWDVQTGEEIRILEGHSGDVCAAAFSPDPGGRWVASAGEDTTVKIWDSRTGRLVRSFRGHTRLVTSIAFSPDGRLLLSGSRDGTVKVWDLTHLEKKLNK